MSQDSLLIGISTRFGSCMQELEQARQAFSDLLRQTDLPKTDWQFELLSRRKDHRMYRLVYELKRSGQPDLVLKMVLHSAGRQSFDQSIVVQQGLQGRLPGISKILAVSAEAKTVLMEKALGATLFDICAETPITEHAEVLEKVGSWLAMFHRLDGDQDREFQPKYTLGFVNEMRQRVMTRAQKVPERNRFLRCLDWMNDTAPRAEDCFTKAARAHGDFNCRNVLIHKETVSVIDFQSDKRLPVGHDIARLLTHYGAFVSEFQTTSGPLPGVDVSGFFKGYDVIDAQDQTLCFLVRARLINDWSKIPQRMEDRTIQEAIRYRGIRKLVERAFK